jgi:SAM-dependent methyltransferase
VHGSNNQDFRNIPAIWPDIQTRPVLDVGCGVGLYTRELARRGAVVAGIDLNVDSLREAKKAGGKVHLVCADASHLPFRSDAFDMVVSIEVLSHIGPDIRRRVMADISRTMAVGGVAFYTLHNRRRLTLSRWMRLRGAQRVYHTSNLDVWPSVPEEGRAMVEESGLAVTSSVRYFNYHSRFTYGFFIRSPQLSKLVIAVEELLTRIPLLRRLAITFLLSATKPMLGVGESSAAEKADLGGV